MCFIGLLLTMPMVQKQKISAYWEKRRTTNTPGIQEIISRDEFWNIKKNIRFYNEEISRSSDPFYKVRFLIDEILKIPIKFILLQKV